MAVNASKCAIMAVNCDDPAVLKLQRQTVCTTDQYTYLGYIMNPKWSVAGTIKNNKMKAQKAMYAGYYFLNRSDVLTELKVRFINSVLLPIGCYGGETFGMSENRCRPIQTVIDQATRMVAKVGKNAAMERIREELGIRSVFLRTSTARERAYIKWPASKTWIADLINQPIKAQKSTWVTGCSRWIKKYCTKNAAGQTVIPLANRKAKNNKSKIQHWLGLVGKLLVEKSKKSLSQLRSGAADQIYELETAKFFDGIRVAKSHILESISDLPAPLKQ
ncbi:hypothetical protein AYI70_g3699 [Smittium culicis]|uniref:RNA-directed DNA polymerase from mobile element jockey n=2 Tax=Smittium culicis TaxID=133412 RepID=A0A1R1Y2H6_9FUNG|nr:hypothetical protein AYI70_g3699 [Smittium culicis]